MPASLNWAALIMKKFSVAPLMLRAMRIDPAIAAMPLLTTVTDACGFAIVLGLAAHYMQYLVP
ncbi:MAG: magnesium transporter [Armatimonadetes bacterium]|nr:magnesium transporter [Armatimonadota bacterium]